VLSVRSLRRFLAPRVLPVWQWLHHEVKTVDDKPITRDRVQSILKEEVCQQDASEIWAFFVLVD